MGEDYVSTVSSPLELTHEVGIICAHCEEDIHYGEEVVLLEVVQVQKLGGQMRYYSVKDLSDPQGDFLFEPYHFCVECWRGLFEDMREEVDNKPPLQDLLSAIECCCCGSGIRGLPEVEYASTFTIGEFRVSIYQPVIGGAWKVGPGFVASSKPDVVCAFCIGALNEWTISMWDDFSHNGECIDCVQSRCWRQEHCRCCCHE